MALGLFVIDDCVIEAHMPVKAPSIRSVCDWPGLYVGAHAGFGRCSSTAVLADPATSTTSNSFDGMIGGVQAGYIYKMPTEMLLGMEAHNYIPNFLTSHSSTSSLPTRQLYSHHQL